MGGESSTEAATYLQVPLGPVEAAVAYDGEYRDEIDGEIEFNESEYERGRSAPARVSWPFNDESSARRAAVPADPVLLGERGWDVAAVAL